MLFKAPNNDGESTVHICFPEIADWRFWSHNSPRTGRRTKVNEVNALGTLVGKPDLSQTVWRIAKRQPHCCCGWFRMNWKKFTNLKSGYLLIWKIVSCLRKLHCNNVTKMTHYRIVSCDKNWILYENKKRCKKWTRFKRR